MHSFNASNKRRLKEGHHKRRIRLLLVDDHPSVLAGIRGYLKSRGKLVVVGHTGSGGEAVKIAKALHPDVVIVDLSLPDIGGLEVIRRVRSEDQEVRFLVYTMHDGKEFLREAYRAGAAGFVSKAVSLNKLAIAIRRVSRGDTYTAPNLADTRRQSTPSRNRLITPPLQDGEVLKSYHPLTEREAEILRSLSDGTKLSEIAANHGISFHTVVSHLRNIYTKLGVRNRTAAVSVARKMGVV